MAKCPNCGAPMQENRCPYCQYVETVEQKNGIKNAIYKQAQNEKYTQNVSTKSKIVALILCIFFGYFGAHKFYVGKIGMGIIYLLTIGIFGFGWIIDIILILFGEFKDSNNLPLKQWEV